MTSNSTSKSPPNPNAAEDRMKAALEERDHQSMIQLLKDSHVVSYEPRVLTHLVHRMRQYTTEILADAKDYADHAGRVKISLDDVRLAARKKQEALAAGPLTREDVIWLAEEVNRIPLPPIPDEFGLRLPPPEFQTTLPDLQWEVLKDLVPPGASQKRKVGGGASRSHGGSRNKKSKGSETFKINKPFTLKEKEDQHKANLAKAEAKMKKRQQGLNVKRST